jgi:hypothetical protein
MINPDGSYNRSPFPRNGHPFKEFQKHVAMRMNKDGRPMPFPFIVLGVVGEWGEMDDEVNFGPPEKVIDEAGDVLWYLQACLASKGFSECTLLDLDARLQVALLPLLQAGRAGQEGGVARQGSEPW